MPRMGDLAAQDDVQFAPYGVGSSAETANAPSGMGALAKGAYQYLGDLAKRAFVASEQMRMGGSYNPAPIVEAAMLPMTGAVAGTGPGGFAVGAGPIKAYHSSPHDFDKFDLAKIGTGEGAQVYGHGLYFAENPAVSGQGGQYWQQFLRKFEGSEKDAAQRLWGAGFDREAAARLTREAAERYTAKPSKYLDPAEVSQRVGELQRQHEMLASGNPVGPRTYEVNIKADPAHMLDWDKPLREQAAGARLPPEMIDQAKREAYNRALGATTKSRADELWGMVKDPLQAPGGFMIDASKKFRGPETSSALEKAGIPGIKYLDQGSRNATPVIKMSPHGDVISSHYPPPSSNYVIFDPSIIDIMKKYGIAGAAPAGMGALAAQDTYKGD